MAQGIVAGPVVDFVRASGGELFGAGTTERPATETDRALGTLPGVTGVVFHDSDYRAPGAEDVPTVYAAVRQPATTEAQRNGSSPADRIQQAAWAILNTTGVVK